MYWNLKSSGSSPIEVVGVSSFLRYRNIEVLRRTGLGSRTWFMLGCLAKGCQWDGDGVYGMWGPMGWGSCQWDGCEQCRASDDVARSMGWEEINVISVRVT